MRNKWIWIAGCVLLACVLVACTTKNVEKQKQIAEKTRMLGEAFLRDQRYQEALREFLKAEKFYSNDHLLHDDLGRVYLALGEHELAIKHFKKSLEINPEYTPARNNLGNAYAVTKNWDKAIEQYKISADSLLYATPHYPLANIGFVYYQQKKYDLAKKYYRESLRVKRDYVGAMHGLGRTYMATGKVADAIEIMEKAVELAPDSAFVNYDLGNAYRMNRQYQKAITFYNKAAQLQPNSELADRALEEAHKIENLQ
jgi:tetratricopeptide (TPR) repeat protein